MIDPANELHLVGIPAQRQDSARSSAPVSRARLPENAAAPAMITAKIIGRSADVFLRSCIPPRSISTGPCTSVATDSATRPATITSEGTY